jgi:hypothetical protein
MNSTENGLATLVEIEELEAKTAPYSGLAALD